MKCVYGRAGVITKFSRTYSLPNFVTHGAPLRALRARELRYKRDDICINMLYITTVERTDSTKLGTTISYRLYL